jgi:hypothetical protein
MDESELPPETMDAAEPTPATSNTAKRLSAMPKWLGRVLGHAPSGTSEQPEAHSPDTSMWNDGQAIASARLRFLDVASLAPDQDPDESEALGSDEELDRKSSSHAELARLLDTISELLSALPEERGGRSTAHPVARPLSHHGNEPDPIGEVQAALQDFRLKLLDIYGDHETAADGRFS